MLKFCPCASPKKKKISDGRDDKSKREQIASSENVHYQVVMHVANLSMTMMLCFACS